MNPGSIDRYRRDAWFEFLRDNPSLGDDVHYMAYVGAVFESEFRRRFLELCEEYIRSNDGQVRVV